MATLDTHVQPSIGGCLKFAPNTWQCCDQADAGYEHFKVPYVLFRTLLQKCSNVENGVVLSYRLPYLVK
jgi:hypothetical protein